MEVLFPLGRVLATPGALDAITRANQTPDEFLSRHVAGDWSELDAYDVAENFYSLKHGFRVLSSYHTNAGETVWLITEADRASTNRWNMSISTTIRFIRSFFFASQSGPNVFKKEKSAFPSSTDKSSPNGFLLTA